MRIFDIILIIGICLMIVMGTIFASAMFSSVSLEGNSTHESETVTQFGIVNAWTIVISALGVITVVVIALKLLRESAS